MESYTTTVTKTEMIAHNTLGVWFEKPHGFIFEAGQYVVVGERVKDPNAHTFSIASAPYEKEILIATRLRSTPLKNTLSALKPGDSFMLYGPGGSFLLPESETVPVVFLAGGIGITPVRSMVLQEVHNKSARNITLLYSDKTPDNMVFYNEFSAIQHPSFSFIPTYTDVSTDTDAPGGAERGRIASEMIRQHVDKKERAQFYITGSPGFVNGMRDILTSLDVRRDQIHIDEFFGY